MSKDDGCSKNGTRHILKDLASSTVRLHRTNFIPPTQYDQEFPVKIEGHISSPELRSCSICSESIKGSQQIAAKSACPADKISNHDVDQQLNKFRAKFSIKLQPTDVDDGRFTKLRIESKISAPDLGCPADPISHNGDDDQKLTGFVEVGEEFSVKVEPINDNPDDKMDDITPDPLTSKSDDDSDVSDNPENEIAEKQKCCRPCKLNFKTDRIKQLAHFTTVHDKIVVDIDKKAVAKQRSTPPISRRHTPIENLRAAADKSYSLFLQH
ncbi:hypothetical protein Fcan01_26626 [Folsomia candida]|uniref:Uncharacterized protein n=1 Tax=Folsomia candida TaxID=158441 RepID=A0A226D1B9_FOLCA|nr:hypothetical protein Fcan01_26626 [Folsomia candida]